MTTMTFPVDALREQLGSEAILHYEDGPHMPCIVVEPSALRATLLWLRDESPTRFDFLSDLAGADGIRLNWDNWPGRFHVVYHLRSTSVGSRIRVKVPVGESSPEVPSIHDLWRSADWMEREVFDMFGVTFTDHPNMKRILCHHKFRGHALRKDYFIQDGQPLDDAADLMDELGDWGESPDDGGFSELIPVNIGPAHPATHGTLRILAKLDGETIVKAIPEIGYLHRGFEKHCEEGTYTMAIPYTDRLNYCSAMLNNVAWCHTVETMLDVQLPERTQVIRVIVSELSRIIDHCVCLGAILVDLGALTNFWYLFNLRERIYSILEALCGARLTSTYLRIGGVSHDLNDEFVADVRAILRDMPKNINDVLGLIAKNRI
ncbi:MAG: NADH-quinone oxidoreductase subunit C, partial [Pirellulaceae bacterium]|nr:NADH-quinone oxidoreductase subunit C [Pirellulaceae bacterium]